MHNFENWIFEEVHPDEKIQFMSWGFYDKDQISKECILNGYQGQIAKLLIADFRNLKFAFGDVTGIRKGRGLERALEYLRIPLEGTHHRGVDDARNIGKIFEKIYSQINW
jgi:inhibitor of KinA sporulation pathway (predicted exonuclease)